MDKGNAFSKRNDIVIFSFLGLFSSFHYCALNIFYLHLHTNLKFHLIHSKYSIYSHYEKP